MKKIFTALFLVLICNSVFSQVGSVDLLNNEMYKARVKLIDEFFDRFNGKEINPLINNKDTEISKKNILMLFNYKFVVSKSDSVTKEAMCFVDTAISSNIRLNYNDSNWFAKVKCVGSLKGKACEFTLYLTVENRKDDMYKWVINRAEGGIFRLKPSLMSDKVMLMPDEHESRFMSLHRITNQKDDYILNYSQKKFNVDETSSFFSLVYYGLLNIDYVKDVEFNFLQVPGFCFTVREIEHNSSNAGWLIDKLAKMSKEEKNDLLNFVHNSSNIQYQQFEKSNNIWNEF